MHRSDKQIEYKMPNMRDGKIDELYNGKGFQKLRQAFRDGKQICRMLHMLEYGISRKC